MCDVFIRYADITFIDTYELLLYIRYIDRKQTGEKRMTRLSYTQVASEFQLVDLELVKESKGYSCNGEKFTNLQAAREWCLKQGECTGDTEVEARAKAWMNGEEETITLCEGNTCPAILPVLPEDEDTFCFPSDSDDVEEFRQLLDHSLLYASEKKSGKTVFANHLIEQLQPTITVVPYKDIRTDDWFSSTLRGVVEMIKKHSRGRCDRLVMGFSGMVYQGQSYWEMTNRTPRSVYRRARRFISEILKASKGMPYAQYSR